jgi:polysaccharide biosynthesis/export protein
VRHASQIFFGMLVLCATASLTTAPQAQNLNPDLTPKCIAVLGAVRAPARLASKRRMRLTEVIAIAGGLTDKAGPTIQIMSAGARCNDDSRGTNAPSLNELKLRVYKTADLNTNDEDRNPVLEPGDVVVVTEAECVYIVGAVVQPRQIALKSGLTLSQAIAMAGGPVRYARTDKVAIYRQPTSSGPRLQLMLNLDQIRKKRAEDLVLQPNDIIEVPDRYRYPTPMFWDPARPIYDAPRVLLPGYRVVYGLRSGI